MTEADNLLSQQVKETKTPSVQYLIFDQEKVIHQFTEGFADIKNQLRVNGSTTYNAYSVTKTFTAIAVLQLAEIREFRIDEPVKKYLPDFPYSPEITIRQLLTHSAGIPNPLPLSWIHLIQEHVTFDRHKFFNRVISKNDHVKFGPNEKFSYSNLGYVILGQLIERISGITYEQYINDHILKLLGLRTDELGFDLNIKLQAKGYQKRFSFSNALLTFLIDKSKYMGEAEGKWKPFKYFYVNGVSYGGLIGTATAFVIYIQELLKPNCKLLSEESKKLLFKENLTRDNAATGMCLSWFTGQLNGQKYFTHAGGGGGYYCEIRIYPDLRIGSIIMFNRTGMRDERFLNKLDKYFLTIGDATTNHHM